jgi:hypothetical protein
MAPESIGQRKYSKQSDVWMFGIVGRVLRFITTLIISIIIIIIIIITIDCRFVCFFSFEISTLHTLSLHFSLSFSYCLYHISILFSFVNVFVHICVNYDQTKTD